MATDHKFHSDFALEAYSSTRRIWDEPLFSCRSFVALPSVGSLLQGWLLVVPRKPLLSMAQLSKPLFSEMSSFLDEVASIVENTYGPIAIFEHGASAKISQVGCGVDHAHIHIVPTTIDLLRAAKLVAPNILWNTASDMSEVRRHSNTTNGYWFLQQHCRENSKHIGICSDDKPASQLFRRVIANALGEPDRFDWKTCLGQKAMANTVASLAKHSFSHE